MSVPGDFQQMLDIYKNYYAAYKVTGNVGYKSAYERALNGVNQHIARMNASMAEDAAHIQDFMATYEKSNGIITTLDNRIKGIKKEGPTLENDYEKTKRLHQKEIQTVDNTYTYIKGGIVVGLLITAGIIGSL